MEKDKSLRATGFAGFLKNMQDPVLRKEMIKNNRFHLIAYGVGLALLFFVYHVISDGDFSFLLTLGGMTRLFGLCLLLVHLIVDKSSSGVSLKTLEMYAAVFFFRLCSILFYEGYLPYDSSGDWFYQAVELTSFGVTCGLIFLVGFKMKESYDEEGDAFGHKSLPKQFGIVFLAVPCFILAIIIHPKLNSNFFTDTAWTFALYLETVAVIPQLFMFQKSKTGIVEPWTSHFVFSLGLSRFFLFIFWLSSYQELSDRYSESLTGSWVGFFVLLNQILHLVVMGDYLYFYLQSAKNNSPLVLSQMQV